MSRQWWQRFLYFFCDHLLKYVFSECIQWITSAPMSHLVILSLPNICYLNVTTEADACNKPESPCVNGDCVGERCVCKDGWQGTSCKQRCKYIPLRTFDTVSDPVQISFIRPPLIQIDLLVFISNQNMISGGSRNSSGVMVVMLVPFFHDLYLQERQG